MQFFDPLKQCKVFCSIGRVFDECMRIAYNFCKLPNLIAYNFA
jgi:hypothetical protein